jgi:tetratricopeptide (TPR) repeat protein
VASESEADAEARNEVHEAAQHEADDAAAKEYFMLGRAAYRVAQYQQALTHFRHAYELSGRSELQYNIGISADRLGHSEEALEAFERYLEGTGNPSREEEVRMRAAVLRVAIEDSNERKERLAAAERTAAAEAERRDARLALADGPSSRRVPRSAIVGGSTLAALGVGGLVAMGVGLSQNGACQDTDLSGVCLTERSSNTWTFVYGGLGGAALAGSATWLAISSRRAKSKRETAWMLTPTGGVVSGSF